MWVALLAGACATELDVKDDSTFFPTLRVSKKLNHIWTIDAIADYAAGTDTATGSTGTPIVIGGTSFPGAVQVDFDLTTVRVEARAHHDISDTWLIEGFLGAALYYTDVTVTAGGVRGDDTQFTGGPEFGGRLGWRPAPRLQVYAESYLTYPFPDGIVPLGEFEAGLEWKAVGPMSVFGGWRWRNLELIRNDSDFDFEWSGVFLGLGFDF